MMNQSCIKKYLALSIFLSLSGWAFGQVIFQPKPVEYNFKGVLYNTEKIFDMRVHTSGVILGYKTGKLKSYYNTSYYNFELGYIKDSRERRQNKNVSFPGEGISSSFIYGKQNHFLNLRVSAGGKRFLSEKTRRKGVAVGFIYEAGATIGLLKPMYIEVIRNNEETFEPELVAIKYTDETADEFLAFDDIYGGTNFFKGLTETDITVGAHGKLAGHFALGAFEDTVKAIEAGIMVDIFPSNVPILVERAEVENRFLFINLYLSLQFGKRK